MKERIEGMLEKMGIYNIALKMVSPEYYSDRLLLAFCNDIELILAEFKGLENAFRAERDAKIRLAAEVELLKEQLKAIAE